MSYAESSRLLLKQKGFTIPKTTGSSMHPLFWEGDHRVAVVPLEDEPEVGEILMFAYRRDGEEVGVLHRLIRIESQGYEKIYITRGDNCLGCERTRREDIIGRVEEVHRLSGWRPWHIIHARKFTVNDPAYRRYVRVWTAIWPLRAVVYRLRGYALAALRRLRVKW